MSEDIFRSAHAGRRLFMAWVTLGVPYVVEQMAEAGYDAVLIDRQHGIGGHTEMVNCLTAARAAGLPSVVRPVTSDPGLIGQALDAGAQGVVAPLIESAAGAEAVVRAVKYPPRGQRSWGPYRGKYMLEGDHFAKANGWTIACVQIETRGAMDTLDEILSVDGLDMVLVGPNDLAMALTGKRDIHAPEVIGAIDRVLKKAREHSVLAAIFANDAAYAKPLVAAGWDIVTIGTDMGLMLGGAREALAAAKG